LPTNNSTPDNTVPSPAGTEPERNTVRIFQTHNVGGTPEAGEFAVVIHHRSINTLGSDAMDFLRPMNPTQTENPGVFAYNDPARGSGWLRLEHFSNTDAARIQELVRMEEISRAVGKEPLKNPDIAFGNAMAMRTNNPWVMFAVAAGAVIAGIGSLTAIPRVDSGATAIVVVGIILILAGIGAGISGAIRLPWWRKARKYARENGGKLPSDLTGL
jgi:hypothetical protein